MIIFPAIDLRGGKVVRLSEGDYNRMEVYTKEPDFAAESFKAQGAMYLHVVDLDGAASGEPTNRGVIEGIIKRFGLFVQVGGGIRDEDTAKRYFDIGVSRVILGTTLIENPGLSETLASKYPGMIAAGIDARDGFIAIRGWKQMTDIKAIDCMQKLKEVGIDTVVYTDIARDGMMKGANHEAYREAGGIEGLNVIASGGVSFEKDVKALSQLDLYGAIIGKALYEGKLDLKRVIRIAGAQV